MYLHLTKQLKNKNMIKKIILPLIAIIMLSSCANKFSLQKRKYTKGFYFAKTKSNTLKNNDVANTNTKTTALPIKTMALPIATENTAEITIKPIAAVQNNYVKTAVKQTKASQPVKQVVALASKSKVTIAKIFKPVKLGAKKGGGDTNIILLVILSLFPILALIAIYLKDGKSITLNFWVDLILHFLFLYWLFALLVVLDVVNLA